LNIKRSIRDSEPLVKKFEEEVSAVVGFPVTVAIDYATLAPLFVGHRNSEVVFPAVIAEHYLPNVILSLKKLVASEDSKKALTEKWTSKKFSFALMDEKEIKSDNRKKNGLVGDSYNCYRFNAEGNFELVSSNQTFYSNIDDVGRCDLAELLSAGGMPLEITVAWKAHESDRNESLKSIRSLLSEEKLELDIDVSTIYHIVKKDKEGDSYHFVNQPGRAGEGFGRAVSSYLKGLVENLKKTVKDDMIKEAIQESLSSKKIRFQVATKDEYTKLDKIKGNTQSNYCSVAFIDGALTIVVRIDNFEKNVDHISFLDLSTLF